MALSGVKWIKVVNKGLKIANFPITQTNKNKNINLGGFINAKWRY